MSYTKLANSILTSTIWMEDDHTRIVWMALLAMADKNGEVQASIPGLANVARVPIESCLIAINKFLSPDPYSRTKDDEGRRIQEIKGGWFLINHPEYRKLASDEDRRERAAERQQRLRDRIKQGKIVTPPSRQWCDKSRQNPQAEAEAEAEANSEADPEGKEATPPISKQTELGVSEIPHSPEKVKGFKRPSIEEVRSFCAELGLPASDGDSFFFSKESNGWQNGTAKIKNWKATIRNWKLNGWMRSQKEGAVSAESKSIQEQPKQVRLV